MGAMLVLMPAPQVPRNPNRREIVYREYILARLLKRDFANAMYFLPGEGGTYMNTSELLNEYKTVNLLRLKQNTAYGMRKRF